MKKRSTPDLGKAEWKSSGSLMNKPTRGWAHSDSAIADGVTYRARYVGCVKILQSVKTLSLDDRGNVIRIAMAKCCDKAGLLKYKKKNKIPHGLSKSFGDIFTGYCGENVLVTISKSSIKIVLERTGVLICDHFIENISFASAGEKDYSSFVSYIAKDNIFERACFVLECALDIKTEVIQTIGQAFEAKYKDFIKKPPQAAEIPEKFTQLVFPEEPSTEHRPSIDYTQINERGRAESTGSAEYSFLQRGGVPPPPENNQMGHYDRLAKGHEYTTPRPDVLPLVAGTDYSEINNRDDFTAIYDNPMASPTTREQLLIDINDNSPQYQVPKNDFPRPELTYDNPLDLMQQRKPEQAPKQARTSWEQFDDDSAPPVRRESDSQGYLVPNLLPRPSAQYASLNHTENSEASEAEYQSPQDITDYQHPKAEEYQHPNTHYQVPPQINKQRTKSEVGSLDDKLWFHGNISRLEAELLIEKDGQFLVRESSSTKGQYVLSGMKDGQHRHLLLVDPEGQVRTKDRTFATVEELILYHRGNKIPIISGGSEVHISLEVHRTASQGPRKDSVEI